MSDRGRRSLTHVGGAATLSGDDDEARLLAHAMDVDPSTENEAAARAHVHGFHTYPARMHPVTAARLIRDLAPKPRSRVLDPFCGSGTVLVEALAHGHDALGCDLNPIAVELARVKTRLATTDEGEALVAAARKVSAVADERRKTRAGATRRFPTEDVSLFAPHVLLELDGLRTGLESLENGPERDALRLVLSSLLVKLSRQESDTTNRGREARIAAGYPAKLFVKKAQELAASRAALRQLAAADPAGDARSRPARVRVELDDATKLTSVRPRSIDLVVTSPPYVATYDYVAHHALRLRWLSLDVRAFARAELGSRRRYAELDERSARAAWGEELAASLEAMARVLAEGGLAVLLLADSALQAGHGRTRGAPFALRADEAVADVLAGAPVHAARRRLVLRARATQARPHFHAPTSAAFKDRPRAEHALLLRLE